MFVNWKMPTTTKAGIESGSMIRTKIPTSPAPSTRAASISSPGIAVKKFRKISVVIGSP